MKFVAGLVFAGLTIVVYADAQGRFVVEHNGDQYVGNSLASVVHQVATAEREQA